MKLSLIIPCYNEAENVLPFQEAVMRAFRDCDFSYELIFIDDGSTDETLSVLHEAFDMQKCPIKVISFSRNFGKESGMYAGLLHAEGEYTTFIDADLQQRPEIVLQMISILENNPDIDVVSAYQVQRHENKTLITAKELFYKINNLLSDVELKPDASDFRTFRTSVRKALLQMREYHRFTKGIFSWVGFQTYYIPYEAPERKRGVTKWTIGKLIHYAMNGMIGFSTSPLRLATILGGLSGFAAILYLLVVIIKKLTLGIEVAGYPTIVVLILFFGSIQLFCIGIIGEYIGRIFEQAKNRPIYISREELIPASQETFSNK